MGIEEVHDPQEWVFPSRQREKNALCVAWVRSLQALRRLKTPTLASLGGWKRFYRGIWRRTKELGR